MFTDSMDAEVVDAIEWLKKELFRVQEAQYVRFKLLARLDALRDANCQSHRFYDKLHQKHMRENIVRLMDAQVNFVTQPYEVIQHCIKFYEDLLAPREDVSPAILAARESLFAEVRCQVDPDVAVQLDAPVTQGEVEAVLSKLPMGKSPSWDGLTNEFFRKYVDQLAATLTLICQRVWDEGYMSANWKLGILYLLPKVPSPISLAQWRPISLMGIMYKIFTKIFANCFAEGASYSYSSISIWICAWQEYFAQYS